MYMWPLTCRKVTCATVARGAQIFLRINSMSAKIAVFRIRLIAFAEAWSLVLGQNKVTFKFSYLSLVTRYTLSR